MNGQVIFKEKIPNCEVQLKLLLCKKAGQVPD